MFSIITKACCDFGFVFLCLKLSLSPFHLKRVKTNKIRGFSFAKCNKRTKLRLTLQSDHKIVVLSALRVCSSIFPKFEYFIKSAYSLSCDGSKLPFEASQEDKIDDCAWMLQQQLLYLKNEDKPETNGVSGQLSVSLAAQSLNVRCISTPWPSTVPKHSDILADHKFTNMSILQSWPTEDLCVILRGV